MNGVFSSAQRRGDGCISGDSERDNCVEKIFELKYFSPITCGGLLPRGTSWRQTGSREAYMPKPLADGRAANYSGDQLQQRRQ